MIRIQDGSGLEAHLGGAIKLAMPLFIPETSVDVLLIGTDAYGYTDYSRRISLVFEQEVPCEGPRCEFAPKPPPKGGEDDDPELLP